LHDIEITPAPKETGNDKLILNVTAKTYRYMDEEEVMQSDADKRNDRKGKKGRKSKKGKKG
jgi:Tfp pilus assembly protein PilO